MIEDYSEGATPRKDGDDKDQQSHVEEAPQIKRLKKLPDLKKLRDRAIDHWSGMTKEYREDVQFSFGEQWTGGDIQKRQAAGRPSFIYNLVPAFVHTVTNAARQAPPGIMIYAVGDGASKQAAKALSGLIKGIEYESNAQNAYIYALECAVKGGFGSWRINMVEDYDHKIDFRIDSIIDPTLLLWDTAARRPDFSDARFVVYEKLMDADAAAEQWPKYADEIKAKKDGNDEILISELWAREECRVVQYVFTDDCLLDINDEYPGKVLPFVTITGERGMYDSRVHYHGLVRGIKEVQREYNYLKSEAIASISNRPKAMAIAEENALENHIEDWAGANRVAKAVLFKKKGSEVTILEPPSPPVGYMQLADANVQVMKMITGIYAPSTGEHVDAASGKALKYEQAQGALSTYHFLDSLKYGVKRTAEILIDLIPSAWVDDAIRVAIHPDGKTEPISVGPNQLAEVANLDMSYGKYGVSISSGPAYASQKEELQSRMMDMMKMNPQMAGIIGPWLVQSIELPGSESIADALMSTLPPQVQQILSAQDDPTAVVRQMAQQIGELQQQLQQAQAQLQHGSAEQVKAQTQMQLKQMDIQGDIEKAKMQIAHENNQQQTEIAAKTMIRDADSHDTHQRASMATEAKQNHDATMLGINHARDEMKGRAQAEAAERQRVSTLLNGVFE